MIHRQVESSDGAVAPFEKNLEVWRQLWRVIEKSDLIVQIVDCRNPLLFRSIFSSFFILDVLMWKCMPRRSILINDVYL